MTIERGSGRPKRYQLADGTAVPSVSKVLAEHGKADGLCVWSSMHAAKAAAMLGLTEEDCARKTSRYWHAVKTFERERDRSAKQGSAVHEVIQAHILGDDVGPLIKAAPNPWDAKRCLMRWREWEDDRGAGITWLTVEVPFVTERFGGTPDMTATLPDGRSLLADIKNGKSIYRKHGRQVGLYRYGLTEATGWRADDAVILHVRPDAPVRHCQFGGEILDAYEAAGLADLAAFEANERCPLLPGMWQPKKKHRRSA